MDDKIKEKIILIAKEEFMAKGFIDASMRNISAKAGLTTGSLYNRFKDKDELFGAIVRDNANELLNIFNLSQREFSSLNINDKTFKINNYVNEKILLMIDYLYENFDIFKLIICKSKGSKYENYVESFISIEQDYTNRYMDELLSKGIISNKVPEDISHMLASSLFNGFFQIVDHNYSKEEGTKYISMLYNFFRAGWNELFENFKEQ